MRFSDDTDMLALLSDFASYQSYLSSVVRFSSWWSKNGASTSVVIELSLVLLSSTVNLWNMLILSSTSVLLN